MIYKRQWETFKRDYAKIFLIVLLSSLVLSISYYFYLSMHKEVAHQVIGKVKSMLPEKSFKTNAESVSYYYAFFFVHNSLAAFYSLLLGLLPLVIPSALCAVATCSTVSALLAIAKNPGMLLLTGILPHGLIEIPALVLSSTLGIYLSLTIAKKLLSSNKEQYSVKDAMKKVGKTFLLVILPLLFIAAGIESIVTPKLIMSYYLH